MADPDAVPYFRGTCSCSLPGPGGARTREPGHRREGGASRSQEQATNKEKGTKYADRLQTTVVKPTRRSLPVHLPLAEPHVPSGNRGGCPALEDYVGGAFADHPVFGWLMGDDNKRRARLRRHGDPAAPDAAARPRVDDQQFSTGAALSLPPGKRAAARQHAAGQRVRGAHREGRKDGSGTMGRHMRRAQASLLRLRHRRAPDGAGQGSRPRARLRPTLDAAATGEGLPAYIEVKRCTSASDSSTSRSCALGAARRDPCSVLHPSDVAEPGCGPRSRG